MNPFDLAVPFVDIDWLTLAPPLSLLITASIGVIYALFVKGSRSVALLSMTGVGVSGLFNALLFTESRTGALQSSFALRYLADQPALAFNFIILVGTALAILVSYDYLQRAGLEQPEYYPLMLLSACGAMVMVAAGDFIALVLGLEIMSLAVYVLSAWRQDARESEEAGMKYFLLGAFASAFLIYGIALMYGATGYFTYAGVAAVLFADGFNQLLLATLGGMFILGGLGFKAAFAPFHQWAPDVYTGAPNSVVAYMSVAVKTAAFAALLRVFATIFPGLSPIVVEAFVVLVGLTLIMANFSALLQRGVKRMLGYSAVAHAGYLGLAVLAAGSVGTNAAIFYLMVYAFMNIGAFAVLTLVSDRNDRGDDLVRFAGLGKTRPWLAASMSLFLLGLAGIPLTAGFIGKIMVFQAAIAAGYATLAVVAIVMSIVAVWYYFRVISYMYFYEPEYPLPTYESRSTGLVIGLAAAATLLFGLVPGWWYGMLDIGQQIVAGF